jgi:hypothetical protein
MLGILMERCLVSTDRCELLFTQVKKIYMMSFFFIEEKDMESDEALWALYHRWCKHHKVPVRRIQILCPSCASSQQLGSRHPFGSQQKFRHSSLRDVLFDAYDI